MRSFSVTGRMPRVALRSSSKRSMSSGVSAMIFDNSAISALVSPALSGCTSSR